MTLAVSSPTLKIDLSSSCLSVTGCDGFASVSLCLRQVDGSCLYLCHEAYLGHEVCPGLEARQSYLCSIIDLLCLADVSFCLVGELGGLVLGLAQEARLFHSACLRPNSFRAISIGYD